MRYFEEILLDLKKKKWKELIKPIVVVYQARPVSLAHYKLYREKQERV